MLKLQVISKSKEETQVLAAKIIRLLKPGSVVLLTGDLGAGKTTFVGGALKELGYKDHVVSPTFNILKCYFEVQPNVFHIDAYRLENQNIDIGLEEFLEGDGVSFVEWPIFIERILPPHTLTIKISRISDNERLFEISSDSEKYQKVFDILEK